MVEIHEYLITTTGIWMLKFILSNSHLKIFTKYLKRFRTNILGFWKPSNTWVAAFWCELFLIFSSFKHSWQYFLFWYLEVLSFLGLEPKELLIPELGVTKVHETYTARRLQYSKTLCWRYWSEHFLHCVHSTHLFIYHPGSQSASNYTS